MSYRGNHSFGRIKHYAENLVYTVTELARAEGYLPMLYTDADYIASNACFEKIGYIRRGELCTVGSINTSLDCFIERDYTDYKY